MPPLALVSGPTPDHADGLALAARFPANVSGTYRGMLLTGLTYATGSWHVSGSNESVRLRGLRKDTGSIVFHLSSAMTTKPEVHYVHGELVLRDGKYISSSDIHMKLEGVYIRPYGQLRVALSSAADPEVGESEDGSPYHMARIYHLPLQDAGQSGKSSGSEPATSAASTCGLRLRLQVSPLLWESNTGLWQHIPSEMLGSLNSPNAPCFAPLDINVTAVNLDKTYNKAVNYTLMVTFISFLQVLFLIRQMEHSNTQSGAAKVSLLMIGQQAVIDAYLCLLHLTAGIVV
eukprot:SM000041S15537  [mRNA]  locus=s41:666523:669320:- [translate_table: standard]